MTTKTKEYYTVSEFAELTGYAVKTVRNMVNADKVKAQKLPGCRKWLIPRDQLGSITPLSVPKEAETERKTTTIKVKNQEGENDDHRNQETEESHQEKGKKGRAESQVEPGPDCGARNNPQCPFEYLTNL
ncbi:MAG: helix-turn-helix domain-containing protein [Planctomycetes bacterium]|nr:helix-turn-helix domain-containing protein [Planctomycetota bacterium]